MLRPAPGLAWAAFVAAVLVVPPTFARPQEGDAAKALAHALGWLAAAQRPDGSR